MFSVNASRDLGKSIIKGTLSETAYSFIWNVVIPDFNTLPGKLLSIPPEGKFTVVELAALLNKYDNDPEKPFHYFVLDHPGWVKPIYTPGEQTFQMVDDIYRGIRNICKTHKGTGILGIMPVQASRTGIQAAAKTEGIYTLEAIGTSSEIGKSSTHVFYISSFDDMKMNDEAIIGCLKDRDGDHHKPFRVKFGPGGVISEPPPPPPSAFPTGFPQFNL